MLAIFALALAFSAVQLGKPKADAVHVKAVGNGKTYIFPLDRDGTYSVQGAMGVSIIRIENGAVYFEDSPCPNKTCIQTGKISRPGQWAACLPNDVFIRIEGGGGIDANAG